MNMMKNIVYYLLFSPILIIGLLLIILSFLAELLGETFRDIAQGCDHFLDKLTKHFTGRIFSNPFDKKKIKELENIIILLKSDIDNFEDENDELRIKLKGECK